MSAVWITRDENGIVDAGIVAEYADPETLKEWKSSGQKPELVDFGPGGCCTIGLPLPATARVIQ